MIISKKGYCPFCGGNLREKSSFDIVGIAPNISMCRDCYKNTDRRHYIELVNKLYFVYRQRRI